MPTLNDGQQSLMARVACRKKVYKINGLLVEKEEEERKTRARKGKNNKKKKLELLVFNKHFVFGRLY